jgi:hypothetical protein
MDNATLICTNRAVRALGEVALVSFSELIYF